MRKAALMTFACVFALAAGAVQMASQPWVTNRIAEAEARVGAEIASATNAIPAPDFTAGNATLRSTIEAVAPAPGNYSAVSNAAMTAATAATNYTDAAVSGAVRLSDYKPEENARLVLWDFNATWENPMIAHPTEIRVGDLVPANYEAVSNAAMSVVAATNDVALAVMDGRIFAAEAQYANHANTADTSAEAVVAQRLGAAGQQMRTAATIFAALDAVQPLPSIVNTWETYWGGSNVVMEVTNYYGNTTGALPRLRIREYRDGAWTNVWDEVDKFEVCKTEILHDVGASNETVLAAVDTKYAPRAWGAYTDKGTTNVIPNSVCMTSPETYFAGGTEYQRVAVGSGAICVLVDRGALTKTTGEPGTFRFQDDGGTNYFGFSKSDSYTIGCRTDGISVGTGNLITLRYDVIMAGTDVPVVYWKQSLGDSTPWAQLNNVDGTVADGSPYAVTWMQDGGSYYASINCGDSPQGFFTAETSVAGDVIWETNMKARLGGGIECTNTATHVNGVIRPKFNGTSVTWEWSAR